MITFTGFVVASMQNMATKVLQAFKLWQNFLCILSSGHHKPFANGLWWPLERMQRKFCQSLKACRTLVAMFCMLATTNPVKVIMESVCLLLAVAIQAWRSLLIYATITQAHQWLFAAR